MYCHLLSDIIRKRCAGDDDDDVVKTKRNGKGWVKEAEDRPRPVATMSTITCQCTLQDIFLIIEYNDHRKHKHAREAIV